MTSFLDDVVDGLSAARKSLPSKYLYDERGSELFEQITALPEYYPTRTETALLRSVAPELAAITPAGCALIEFGSGSSAKTTVLLDAALSIEVYAAIDISEDALAPAAARMRQRYPLLEVVPVVGDFTGPLILPPELEKRPRIGFFPGSTIGNFDALSASAFLANARALLGPAARFIIGFDLVKAPDVLVAAYDDPQGVTAAFNLNLLARINRELGANFDLEAFRHRACWNAPASRMEMHLVSSRAQRVTLGRRVFEFAAGESIHTENSYKYTERGFVDLARQAGWSVEKVWTSPPPSFAVALLGPPSGAEAA